MVGILNKWITNSNVAQVGASFEPNNSILVSEWCGALWSAVLTEFSFCPINYNESKKVRVIQYSDIRQPFWSEEVRVFSHH